MARAYEVDASSMCDVLSGVPGVEDVSLEFDTRGNGVLRVRLRPDVDEDAVVGAAVAQLHRRFGVGLEGGRLRLTGPSGRTVVAVVEPHGRQQPRRALQQAEPRRSVELGSSEGELSERSVAAPEAPPPEVHLDAPAPSSQVVGAVNGTARHTANGTHERATDEKATDEKATDEKATDEKARDEKTADEKARDEKATDEAPVAGRGTPGDVPGLAPEPDEPPVPERRSLDSQAADVPPRSRPPLRPVHDEPDHLVDPAEEQVAALADESVDVDDAVEDALDDAVQESVHDAVHDAVHDGRGPAAGARPGLVGVPPRASGEPPTEQVPSAPLPQHGATDEPEDSRLVLEQVEVATGRLELWATVRLRLGDTMHTGTSSATATGSGAHRAVVAATARAAESALGGKVRLDVEAVDLLGVGTDQVGVVVVTLLTSRGVDRVSGAALVRGDGRETLVRATLDALNRRTESLQLGRLSPPS